MHIFGTLQIYYIYVSMLLWMDMELLPIFFFSNTEDNVTSILRSTCTGNHLSRTELPNLTMAHWRQSMVDSRVFPSRMAKHSQESLSSWALGLWQPMTAFTYSGVPWKESQFLCPMCKNL